MMDGSAINAIRDLVVMGEGNAELVELGTVIVPEKCALQSLERFGDAPKRFRAQFKTDDIRQFMAYVNANGSAASGVFVGDGTATATLDMGDADNPQWGEHTAHLALLKTPEFRQLLERREKVMAQLDLTDFIEDMPECFVFRGGDGQPVALAKAIDAIRKLTVSAGNDTTREVGDFAESYSELDKIAVSSGGNPLPAGFTFTCTPYEGFGQYVFECRLRAVCREKTAKLIYRIVAFESLLNQVKDEFVGILKDGIKVEGVGFYQGSVVYQGKL